MQFDGNRAPSLAGLPDWYLQGQLTKFRDGGCAAISPHIATGMPASRSRFALASELDTVPEIRDRRAASATMKWFTVEPVPTPTIMSSSTKARAASAQSFLRASWSMGPIIYWYSWGLGES